MPLAFIFFTFLIYWDARTSRRVNNALFQNFFTVKPQSLILLIFLFILTASSEILLAKEQAKLPFSFFMFIALSLYLLRRRRFLKTTGLKPLQPLSDIPDIPHPLVLTSDALGVILHWFFIMGIIPAFFKIHFHAAGEETELAELVVFAVFSFMALAVLIAYAARRFSTEGFWKNVGFIRGEGSFLRRYVIPFLLGLFFACLSATLIAGRAVQPETPLGHILETTHSPLAVLTFVVLAIVIAPLIEEIIFRGYFFRVITEVKGEPAAIVIISVIFGFMHVGQYWGDWAAIGMVFLLGFLLTILRAWTQTLTASIITHYTYNVGLMALSVVFQLGLS